MPQPLDARLWLVLVHILGMSVATMWLFRQWSEVRRTVSAAVTANRGLMAVFEEVVTESKLKRKPQLLISNNSDVPFATGIWNPVVLMPQTLAHQLDERQLRIVLAHEVAHIRRRDLLTGWCEAVLSVVWWFHPIMWWVTRQLRAVREECCDDELVSREMAEPGRYCETLIQAAACQTKIAAEPLALGFTKSEHPAVRRIRRLMDASLPPSSRLRKTAVAGLLVAAGCVLPGMQPERSEVKETSLRSLFGGWRNLPFTLTEDEEEVVASCRQLAQQFFSTRNNRKLFDDIAIKNELQEILDVNPDHFYAQHLLGTWHLRNGDADKAEQYFEAALSNAPVILVRRYTGGDGKPIEGVEIREQTLECNRVQNGSLDPGLSLKYVGLVTNSDGEIHLPAFDTVFRLSGAFPDGYSVESKNLGWFESKSRIGVLPTVTAWRPYSKPSGFTRSAAQSDRLRDAHGTTTGTIESGSNTWVLASIARPDINGTFTTEDGQGNKLNQTARALPKIENAEHIDHAIIDLESPAGDRYEITDVEVLESGTKIPLNTYQSGAGLVMPEKGRFHLFSMWDSLPAAVDLLLRVHNYKEDDVRLVVSPALGTTPIGNGDSFTISHLIRGHHQGWDSQSGFIGEPRELDTSTELVFRISGKSKSRYSFWVVTKDGRRWDTKTSGWYSTSVQGGPQHIQVGLEDIDHFELLPYTEPERIYFEKIRLPKRNTPVSRETPSVKFQIGGVPGEISSDVFYPMDIRVRSLRGRVYSGIGGGTNGVSLIEADPNQRKPNELSTVVWSANGTARYNVEVDFNVQFPGLPPANLGSRSSMYAYGKWGGAGSDCRNVPLQNLQSVTMFLTPMLP